MKAASRRIVVFIESAAAMGGVQFSTLYVARALDGSKWRPIVFAPAEGDLTRACRDAGVETEVLRVPRLWSTSVRVGDRFRLPNPFAWAWNAIAVGRASQLVNQALRRRAPGLVVTKGLAAHFVGGFAASQLGIPCVWHVQDFISERNFGIYRRVFGLFARFLPQRIIADGATIKQQLPRSLHSLTTVIHNGVDSNLFARECDGLAVREELSIPKDDLIIGHAGRITPWKGQHHLIEAFARIAHEHPNVSLLFAGSPVFDHDAYERRLRDMAAEYRLENRIKFAGFRHDLPNVLAAMDIFAFTSVEKDTSPLALLSAMAAGLPIVAFDIEGVRELLETNEELLLTPVADPDALARALQTLICDRQLRLRLGQAACDLAQRNFSLEQHVSRIEAVLTDALECSPLRLIAEARQGLTVTSA